MNLRSIIIISSIIGLFATIHFCTKPKTQETKKETKTDALVQYVSVMHVKNKLRSFYLEAYGQLEAGQTLDIAFEVSGRLIEGSTRIRPGVRFSKGQLLYKVDAEESIFALNARKSAFITLLSQVMPDVKMDFPDESHIWDRYLEAIDISKPLAKLPDVESSKLRFLLNQRNIFAEYNNIKSLELRLTKHYFYAPFSGTVTDVFLEPGSIVNPGVRIASSTRTGDFELKIPIAISDLDFYKRKGSVDVYDASGKHIGVGKLVRVSDVINRMTQSLDAYFSIKADKGGRLFNGMYVNVKVNKETYGEVMALPYLAVKNQTVKIIQDSSLVDYQIEIVASIPDSLLVKGLKNNMQVLINSSDFVSDTIKVVGIQK
jgi:multidrug efflux pump subunit AcrA (membrane-fusion protein)